MRGSSRSFIIGRWTTLGAIAPHTCATQSRVHGYQIQCIGRANKTKIYLDRDYVEERLSVAGRTLIYRQIENSFTQPNADINIHMLEWALEGTEGGQGDLLELYCGNGNFRWRWRIISTGYLPHRNC